MEKASFSAGVEEHVNLASDSRNSRRSKSKVFWEKIAIMFSLEGSEPKKTCLKMVVAAVNILLVLTLITTLPNYAQKSNQSDGSTYTSLFVSSFMCVLTLLALSLLKRIWDSAFQFREALPLKELAKFAALQSVGAILVFQSQDRHRTPCHFQDAMYLLCLPVTFIIDFLKSKQGYVCWTRRMLTAFGIFMAALFMSSTFQLANRFHCRGVDWEDPADSFGGWSWESNILWTLIRALGLCLWASGFTLMLIFCSEETKKHRCLESLTWISIFSFGIIAACCWLDTFSSLGKGSTWFEFSSAFAQGFQCHFSTVDDCSRVSLTSTVFVSAWLLFLLTSIVMAKSFRFSPVLIVSCSCLAVPLTSIWWSLFTLSPAGLDFDPRFSANCIAGILAFPAACGAFVYCLKNHQSLRKVVEVNVKSPEV